MRSVLLAALVAMPGIASANLLYTYTSAPLNVGNPEAATNIELSFTTIQALAPSSTYYVSTSGPVTTGTWALSDGPMSVSNCNSFVGVGCDLASTPVVTTNASGQISSWSAAVYVLAGSGPSAQYLWETRSDGSIGLSGVPVYDFYKNYATNASAGASKVGTWAVSPVSPVPLPAAAWLMLSGLGGLGALARKRKAA